MPKPMGLDGKPIAATPLPEPKPLTITARVRPIVTREQAAADNLPTYYDGKTCARGHDGAERFTANGTCCACHALGYTAIGDGDMRAARPLTPRDHARIARESTYTTGEPCKYGHTAPRYVSNRACVECVRLSAPRRTSFEWVVECVRQTLGERLSMSDGVVMIGERPFSGDDITRLRIEIEITTKRRVTERVVAEAVRYVANNPLPDIAVTFRADASDDDREAFREYLRTCIETFEASRGRPIIENC